MPSYSERLHKVIPGGAHTYSRGDDQYPKNAPQILARGKGAYVYDADGKEYLDYGMALRAVTIGYAHDEIDEAAIKQIRLGNNLTRPSLIELEAAELMVATVASVDMVKFAKNGSSAVSAAVKLARAYNGKNKVIRCLQHPFFSYDDWFIGSTVVNRGIPQAIQDLTLTFNYNDIASLEQQLELHGKDISCLVMEPATLDEPGPSKYFPGKNFLHDVKHLCEKHGVVFILDEMITGFRYKLEGAQEYFCVKPDLSTFGKAMTNGFSLAVVGGKREIMELGSINKPGAERVFLLSSTFGGEMSSLGAFVKTVEVIKRDKVIDHLWNYGKKLNDGANKLAQEAGIGDYFKFVGPGCSPGYFTYDKSGQVSFAMKTLFCQEMMKENIVIPFLALSYAHKDKELDRTLSAMRKAFKVYALALENGLEKYLEGETLKPVFRKYN